MRHMPFLGHGEHSKKGSSDRIFTALLFVQQWKSRCLPVCLKFFAHPYIHHSPLTEVVAVLLDRYRGRMSGTGPHVEKREKKRKQWHIS